MYEDKLTANPPSTAARGGGFSIAINCAAAAMTWFVVSIISLSSKDAGLNGSSREGKVSPCLEYVASIAAIPEESMFDIALRGEAMMGSSGMLNRFASASYLQSYEIAIWAGASMETSVEHGDHGLKHLHEHGTVLIQA